MHERRAAKLAGLIAEQPRTAHELARALWGDLAVTQALLTLSEVLGHVDLLIERGEVVEHESRRRRPLRRRVDVENVEVILVSLLLAVVVLSAAARAINVPVPDRARASAGTLLGFIPRAAGRRSSTRSSCSSSSSRRCSTAARSSRTSTTCGANLRPIIAAGDRARAGDDARRRASSRTR